MSFRRCRSCACLSLIFLLCALPAVAGCVRAVPETRVKWELTPSAQATYAALLLDQSIRSSSVEGVLEAVDILARSSPSPQLFSEAAAWLLLNKNTAEARGVLHKAVALLPDSLDLHLLLAETWLTEGDGDKAAAVMADYRKNRPDSPQLRRETGIILLRAGRYAEAEQEFARLSRKDRTPYVRYCRARALLGLHRTDEATEELRQAVREDPEFTEAWSELARVYETGGHPASAAAAYEKLLELDPADQDTWLHLIRLELGAGHTAKALELAHNGPGNYGFILAAATLFLDAKAYDAAQDVLDSIRQEPDVPEEIFFYLAAAAYEKKKSDSPAALEALARITPESRFYDRALRFRIQILFETGDRKAALRTAETAVETFPQDKDFRLMQAQLLMQAQSWDKALAALDKADEVWPDDPELRFTRGTALDGLGLKEQAFAVMEALITAHPEYYRALNYVGYSLAEQGRDLERAIELLRRADSLSPDTAYIMDSLAWAQYRSGDIKAAWRTIRETVRLSDSDEADIWDHYGDIAFAAGNRKQARRGWNKALTLNPEDPAALRRKLDQL